MRPPGAPRLTYHQPMAEPLEIFVFAAALLAQFKPEQAIQSRSPKLDSRRFQFGSAFAGLGAMGLLGWRRKRRAALAALRPFRSGQFTHKPQFGYEFSRLCTCALRYLCCASRANTLPVQITGRLRPHLRIVDIYYWVRFIPVMEYLSGAVIISDHLWTGGPQINGRSIKVGDHSHKSVVSLGRLQTKIRSENIGGWRENLYRRNSCDQKCFWIDRHIEPPMS